ncbi:uncharacterized protein LOC135847730 isoform X1 [Planococcus citri]|uniref:uncharacterized protein LOC135847730 isoform X1 n=1 Tax=Planococcus citri TaxID=170843 RepID=UPI0031FA0F06
MAEKTSNAYSTPVSLEQLSINAVGLELWRSKIDEYRTSQRLERFRASDNVVSLRAKLPELPSVIYDMIVKYVTRLGESITDWLEELIRTVCRVDGNYYRGCVLEYFDDFVCDYDGTIDFVKTAERMMHYDSLDNVLKFILACRCFLEDHVRRIWPSVREKMHLSTIDFNMNPQLYYWICHLSNQLNKVPSDMHYTVDENMLEKCVEMCHSRLAVNYFWNRVPYEDQMGMANYLLRQNIEGFVSCILPKLDNQRLEKIVNEKGEYLMETLPLDKWHIVQLALNYIWKFVPFEMQVQMANDVFRRNRKCFASCILPKLNDRQVEKFFNEKSSELMGDLMNDFSRDETRILQTWTCIIKTMNGSTFSNLVVNMLRTEAGYFSQMDHQKLEKWSKRCCELWNRAPHHLNRSAIIDISSDLELTLCRQNDRLNTRATSCEFLLSILSDFTLEERQSFWRNCWKNLMLNKNACDLQRIMESCFEHEEDMINFKENVIAESENLQLRCDLLMSCSNFDECDALVNFSCPRSAETVKRLKQRYLQSSFLDDCSGFYYSHVVHCKKLDKFINTAYDSVDLANEFKHQLVSCPDNLRVLMTCVRMPQVSYRAFRKFIETFVSNEQILQQVKSFIIDHLKEAAISRSVTIEDANSKPFFDQFLLWCLGSNELVMELQQTYIKPCLEDINL